MDESTFEDIAFVSSILGPLFLFDPASPEVTALYTELKNMDPCDLSCQWPFVDCENAKAHLDTIHLELHGSSDKGLVPDDLIWEHRRLFVGPSIKAAPPWSSVYLDRDGVVFGCSTLSLRSWMRDNRIKAQQAAAEPEDHFGNMLILLAWLARNRPELVDEFLSDHLLIWSAHFLERVKQQTKHEFWRSIAGLTNQTLNGIAAVRDITPKEVTLYR